MSTPLPVSSRAVSAVDRLLHAYAQPGPYLSATVPTEAVADTARPDAFAARRSELADLGATESMLDAMAARLSVPAPDDVGGQVVWVAADGTTIADFGPEPPKAPVYRLGTLPDASTALEWAHWRIPHITAIVTAGTIELAVFGLDAPPSLLQFESRQEAVDRCRTIVDELAIELVVVGGDSDSGALVHELTATVPTSCVIEAVATDEASSGDALADATVRRVADLVARRTVDALRSFRFLREHGEAVDGTSDVLAALASGRAEALGSAAQLLIHADPADARLAYVGDGPRACGLEATADLPDGARLVDAAIRAALLQGARVRIIPSTGDNGPADDIALNLPNAQP